MWIKCHPKVNSIKYEVYIHPNSSSKATTPLVNGTNVWSYGTLVWSVGQPIVIYENGQYVAYGNWKTGPELAKEVNVKRNLAFGLGYTDVTNPSKYGKGYIDAVKMFNRPLNAEEVQALYNTY